MHLWPDTRHVPGARDNMQIDKSQAVNEPWKSWANLDCKGGEADHLLPVLAPVLEKIFGVTMSPAEQKMITCVASLGKLAQIWDESGTFPTEESFALTLSLGKGFLVSTNGSTNGPRIVEGNLST